MAADDWSEFHFWCFVTNDLHKANKQLESFHSNPLRLGDHETQSLAATCSDRVHKWVKDAKSSFTERRRDQLSSRTRTVYTQFTAGAIGGGIATYSTHWLDTVKVKMQSFPQLYSSGVDTLKVTLTTDGVRGLYQGAIPAVLGQTLKSAIVFTSYGFCEELVCNLFHGGQRQTLTVWDHAMAGSMTGVVASFVLCPLELIKCRQQALQNGVLKVYCKNKTAPSYKRGGLFQLTRCIIRSDGFRGLYRGLPGIWIKEIPGSFVYFGSYEMAKSMLLRANNSEHLGSRAVFFSGVFAGLCFCITHPIESVKTRVQVMSALSQTGGFIKTAALILRTEGIKPLCSGMKPTMLRACIFSGIQFMIYEKIKDLCLQY